MKQIKTICDRCGKEITKPRYPFVKFSQTIHFTKLFGCESFDYADGKVELCAKCSKEFDAFMEGSKS